jgi:hypothetical protein
VELIRTFETDQYLNALDSWRWLGLAGKMPIFASPFGDVFFEADDGYWWLDTLSAELTRKWPTLDELRAELDTEEGQDRYLLAGLAFGAERQGLVLGDDEIYDFKVSPALGAPIELANICVRDFVVAVNIAGQLADQLRHLAPGTRITGLTLVDGTLGLATD